MYFSQAGAAAKNRKILNLHELRFAGSYKSKFHRFAGRALPLSEQK